MDRKEIVIALHNAKKPLADVVMDLLHAQSLSYKKRIEGMKLMDMEHTEGCGHKTAYQVPFTEHTKGWNDALAHLIQEMEKI
jgi:hypothetical protein